MTSDARYAIVSRLLSPLWSPLPTYPGLRMIRSGPMILRADPVLGGARLIEHIGQPIFCPSSATSHDAGATSCAVSAPRSLVQSLPPCADHRRNKSRE